MCGIDDAGGEELVGGEDGVLAGALKGGVSGLGADDFASVLAGGPGEGGGGELRGQRQEVYDNSLYQHVFLVCRRLPIDKPDEQQPVRHSAVHSRAHTSFEDAPAAKAARTLPVVRRPGLAADRSVRIARATPFPVRSATCRDPYNFR